MRIEKKITEYIKIYESTGRIPPGLMGITYLNPEKVPRLILKKIIEQEQEQESENEKMGASKLFNPKKPEFIKELDRVINKAKEEGIRIGVGIGFNLVKNNA